MKTNVKFILPILAILCSSIYANAALIVADTFTASVPATDTNWVHSISLPQYDSSLHGGAMLQEICIHLDGEVVTTVDIEAITETTILSGSAGAFITAIDASLGLSLMTNPSASFAPPSITLAAGDSQTIVDLTSSDSDSTTITGAATAPYVGSGTITFDLEAQGTQAIATVGGNLDVSQRTQALGTVTIEYKIIPEPSTIAMAMFGVLGLLGFRRRR